MTNMTTRLGLAGTFCLGFVQILTWGGSFFLIAIFGGPIIRDTGWSPRWVYGALSVGILVSGLLSPLCGRLIDRQCGRNLLGWSGVVIAAGLSIMAMADNLVVFTAAWVVIGVGMAMGLYDPLFAVLGSLFGYEARQAISRITLISGFCTTLVWPMLSFLVDELGWRNAALAYAALLVVCVFPIYAKILPDTNGSKVSVKKVRR